jgi:hypothetical protein
MMGYKIHRNKTTKHKQKHRVYEKNDYETVETLTLNIASNTHKQQKKLKQWHGFTF